MTTIQHLQTQRVITETCNHSFQNIVQLLDSKRIWMSIEEYAEYHGTSRSSIEKAIASGIINVENGGLKKGTEKRGATKLIFRFFNHLIGQVNYPQI